MEYAFKKAQTPFCPMGTGDLFSGAIESRREADTHFQLMLRSRKLGFTHSLPICLSPQCLIR
jgi:hypothetical protein